MIIRIDGADIKNRDDFFDTLAQQIDFPDYFGKNLDALYDILSERDPDLTVEFVRYDELEEAVGSRFLYQLKRLFADVGVTTRRNYDEEKAE